MKKGIILVCVVTVLLAGCGGVPTVAGYTYRAVTDAGNEILLTFDHGTKVTMFVKSLDVKTVTYPYSLTGDTVTIYPQEDTSGGVAEDLKMSENGNALTGPDELVYHREVK